MGSINFNTNDPGKVFTPDSGPPPYSGPGDTPGTPEAALRHPDWVTNAANATDVFKKSFNNVAGRDPTQAEINSYVTQAINPALLSNATGKFNYTDYTNLAGNYIGSNFDQTKLAADKLTANAPSQYAAVNQSFQTTLGRDATQAEKDHFGGLLGSGALDPYSLNQWLTQLPEAVKAQNTAFQNNLRGTMSTQDARYFNEQIMPQIGQSFAKQGRSFDSSAYSQALAQAAQGQNTAREGFLNNLSVAQYGGSQANAYSAYQNSVQRQQGLQDYSMNRYNNLTDAGTQQLYDTQNYNIQQAAYNQYLQKYGKRGNPAAGALSGGLSGAAVGFQAGGPWGALAGGVAGAGLGAYSASQY